MRRSRTPRAAGCDTSDPQRETSLKEARARAFEGAHRDVSRPTLV